MGSMEPVLVIAPNLKRRLSGVTATIARLVPVQARSIGIRATGPGLPPEVPHLPLARVAMMPRDRWRVWHARRNTEMLMGLFLTRVLRRKFRLLFTSASQRRHSGYTKWLIGQMDAVVATSAKGAAYLDRPADVILHGIDTETFTPAEDRRALREKLGLPHVTLVGCYGRIRKSKGTDNFVKAMIELLPSRPGVTAVVMGRALDKDRQFMENIMARVAQAGLQGRILFKPEVSVDRMADWYAALDLYVAPQRWEGFGLTPLEAMSCGVPVVATDTGAFKELLGDTGLLVPTDDLPALVDAAARMIDDQPLRERMAEAARARVEGGFRIEDEANALIAVYRRMLA